MRPDSPSPLIPFLVACAGIATYSSMDVLMKGLSIGIGAYNAVFWRNVAGALLSGLVYFAARPARPDASTMRIPALRSLFLALMAPGFLWAHPRPPMADVPQPPSVAPVPASSLATHFPA